MCNTWKESAWRKNVKVELLLLLILYGTYYAKRIRDQRQSSNIIKLGTIWR
jgi:hypothetical protein